MFATHPAGSFGSEKDALTSVALHTVSKFLVKRKLKDSRPVQFSDSSADEALECEKSATGEQQAV